MREGLHPRLAAALLPLFALSCAERAAGEGDAGLDETAALDEGSADTEGDDSGTPPACEALGDAGASVELLGLGPTTGPSLDLACTFTGTTREAPTELYRLEDCSSLTDGSELPGPLTLAINVSPPAAPVLDPGTVVRLRWTELEGEGRSFALTAQPGGLLVFAGSFGADLGFDIDPFEVAASDRPCGPIAEACALRFEQRLRFDYADETLALAAGESGDLGDPVAYQVSVGFAARRELDDHDCPEEPLGGGHYDYLVALLPGS